MQNVSGRKGRHKALMERLIDYVPACLMSRLLRLLQFVSGLSLLGYACASFYNFDLEYPLLRIGYVHESRVVMIACGVIQLMCTVFHCPRCAFLASWPAAVIFTYVALCAKVDELTRLDMLLAVAILAGANWFISSVTSWKMKRAACGHVTSRSD